VIPKPEKPIGRLNTTQKDHLFVDEVRISPLRSFMTYTAAMTKVVKGRHHMTMLAGEGERVDEATDIQQTEDGAWHG
jgi:hypothetical protein